MRLRIDWKLVSGAIWEGFVKVHGVLDFLAGSVFAFLAWQFGAGQSVPLWLVVALALFGAILIASLLVACVELSRAEIAPRPLPLTSVESQSDNGKEVLVLLFTHSGEYVLNSFVSVFYVVGGVEKRLGVGCVTSIQADGRMQVALVQPEFQADAFVEALRAKKHEAINSTFVRHFLSVSVPLPISPGLAAANRDESASSVSPASVPALLADSARNQEENGQQKPDPSSEAAGWLDALFTGRFAEARSLYLKYEERYTGDERKLRRVVFTSMLRENGDPDALSELERLRDEPKFGHVARLLLVGYYRESGFLSNAMEEVERADKNWRDDALYSKVNLVISRARVLLARDESADAVWSIRKALETFSGSDDRAALLAELARFYESIGEKELRAVALLAAREASAGEGDLTFKSAFAWSEVDRRELALYLYDSDIKTNSENGASRNNLAVALEHFDLSIHSVEQYQNAARLKETLANANLANAYLNAGFVGDARKVIEDALAVSDDPHPNIATASAAISSRREAEEQKLKKIRETGRSHYLFVLGFAKSRLWITKTPDLSGRWLDSDATKYEVEAVGGKIHLTYEVASRKFRYVCSFEGAAFRVLIERNDVVFHGNRMVYEWTRAGEGLGYVSEDLATIQLWVKASDELRLKALKRDSAPEQPQLPSVVA